VLFRGTHSAFRERVQIPLQFFGGGSTQIQCKRVLEASARAPDLAKADIGRAQHGECGGAGLSSQGPLESTTSLLVTSDRGVRAPEIEIEVMHLVLVEPPPPSKIADCELILAGSKTADTEQIVCARRSRLERDQLSKNTRHSRVILCCEQLLTRQAQVNELLAKVMANVMAAKCSGQRGTRGTAVHDRGAVERDQRILGTQEAQAGSFAEAIEHRKIHAMVDRVAVERRRRAWSSRVRA
jgi:hypothetical protein